MRIALCDPHGVKSLKYLTCFSYRSTVCLVSKSIIFKPVRVIKFEKHLVLNLRWEPCSKNIFLLLNYRHQNVKIKEENKDY